MFVNLRFQYMYAIDVSSRIPGLCAFKRGTGAYLRLLHPGKTRKPQYYILIVCGRNIANDAAANYQSITINFITELKMVCTRVPDEVFARKLYN